MTTLTITANELLDGDTVLDEDGFTINRTEVLLSFRSPATGEMIIARADCTVNGEEFSIEDLRYPLDEILEVERAA